MRYNCNFSDNVSKEPAKTYIETSVTFEPFEMSAIIVFMSFYLHWGLSKMTLPSSCKTHEQGTLLSVQSWRFTSD